MLTCKIAYAIIEIQNDLQKLVFYKQETANGLTAVISYLYDSNDEVYGFTYNNKTYIYVKTIQGDVGGIINATDNIACIGMIYDAWGNVTYDYNEELDSLGKLEAMIVAAMNRIMYRGYFYDYETGLYYLQSRYYDPEVGRFINADDTNILRNTTGTINGANLFAYCNNDPVLDSDPSGLLTIDGFALILDIAFTTISFLRIAKIGYDVVGSGLKYYARKKGFKLFYNKLMYSAVPKFGTMFTKGFTLLRKVIWRATGIFISNFIPAALIKTVSKFTKYVYRNRQRTSFIWSIALRLLSLGSAIALILDYFTDGKIDERIVIRGKVIACG